MYSKPQVQRYGTLRDLTQAGFDQDCDGGIFGIGNGTGDFLWATCDRS